MKKCKIESCTKEVLGLGFCSAHYSKFRKYGDPRAGRENTGGTCKAEGCGKPVHAHRMCSMHYERFKKHGDLTVIRRVRKCSVAGCEGKYRANGFCEFHNGRYRHHGDPLAGGERQLPPNSLSVCRIEGCGKKAVSKHLCAAHNSKQKKYGDPLSGPIQDGRSKEWHERKGGYVIKFDRSHPCANKVSGVVFQHTAVMAEMIGRYLVKGESVHHKNGIRSDNRPSNLELWVKPQPAGQRVKDQVAWAREILREYGDLVDRLV
jgi:hypothetical protein